MIRLPSRATPKPDPSSRGRLARHERPTRVAPDREAERLELAREEAKRALVHVRVGVASDRLARERVAGPRERLDVPPDPLGAPRAVDREGAGRHGTTLIRLRRGRKTT